MATTQDLAQLEKKLLEKEEKLDGEKNRLDDEKAVIEQKKDDYLQKLQKVANLTADEAKEKLFAELAEQESAAMAKIVRLKEEEAKQTADKKVQEILADAMRHGALNFIPEYTVSIVRVTDEEIKGRIIGKEGRNIRAFEQTTGVDIDLDEEGVIKISSFNQIRREIARRSLEKLLKDSRIQPFRIEEVVRQTKQELEKVMLEEGEKICQEIGLYNIPTDLMKMLGRFKFRTSYGQNLIAHSLEVTKIAVALSQELGVNVNIVKVGALFHDIGKVVEGEGSHVTLGVELLKKNNFPPEVIACVAEHHEDIPFSSIESILVHIADAISASRPGARQIATEEYGIRLKEMEKLAKQYTGVEDAYAFQAGRELRVIINPERLDDDQTLLTARKIREEIMRSLAIPGDVKVTAIREFRAVASETV